LEIYKCYQTTLKILIEASGMDLDQMDTEMDFDEDDDELDSDVDESTPNAYNLSQIEPTPKQSKKQKTAMRAYELLTTLYATEFSNNITQAQQSQDLTRTFDSMLVVSGSKMDDLLKSFENVLGTKVDSALNLE
jgi:hypothetical protein